MVINIQIKKKDLFLICSVLVFFLGAGFIVAYGGTNPSVMGHNAEEVSGTILGRCTETCDQNGPFFNCENMFGATCSGTDGDPVCVGHCHCTKGNMILVYDGYTIVWRQKTSSYFMTGFKNSYLCVTP